METVQKESAGDGSDGTIVSAANECLAVLCDCVCSSLGQCQHGVFSFALKQLDSVLGVEYPRTSAILSPLCLLYKVSECETSSSKLVRRCINVHRVQ